LLDLIATALLSEGELAAFSAGMTLVRAKLWNSTVTKRQSREGRDIDVFCPNALRAEVSLCHLSANGIETHLSEEVSADRIAGERGLSVRHLNRLFEREGKRATMQASKSGAIALDAKTAGGDNSNELVYRGVLLLALCRFLWASGTLIFRPSSAPASQMLRREPI
jgi:hypothetical protein